jgi:dihydroxyacid dehydratase/phosphogluconate dehydratase
MSYSLISRDIMAAMVEIHALGHPHDGMVLISGNDKSVPAHLQAIARCDLPAIHLPGGTQLNVGLRRARGGAGADRAAADLAGQRRAARLAGPRSCPPRRLAFACGWGGTRVRSI